MLTLLARHYRVTGVDLSSAMLTIAREKIPNVPLLRQDISKLRVSGEFDVIICIFDTMNHLTRFEQWREVFRRARKALAPGGVFIFDVNTIRKIDLYSSEPPHAEVHRDAICIFDVVRTRGDRYRLDLRLLKRTGGRTFILSEASVPGLAVQTSRIVAAAKQEFRTVSLFDPERKKPSPDTEELYFICSK